MKFDKLYKFYLVGVAVIIIDQLIKVAVHTSMYEGEYFEVFGDVFKIHYVTNPGMAFGLVLGGAYGKIILTLFRLVAVTGIGYYMMLLFRKKAHVGLQICVALIFGGAIGNVVDSTFYSLLFGLESPDAPFALFHGKVVDMFFIDLYEGYIDIPLFGEKFLSLWPIFNFADASIFVAVAIILIFQKRFFIEKAVVETEKEVVAQE